MRCIPRGCRYAKFKSQTFGSPYPRPRDIVVTVSDETDFQILKTSSPFQDRKEIRHNLAGMLLVGEGIYRGDLTIFSKPFDVTLRKCPNHRAVNHSSEYASSVDDRLSPPQLDVILRKEYDIAAQLPDSDLKTQPRPGRWLTKNHRPCLTRQGEVSSVATSCLELLRRFEQRGELCRALGLNGKKMVHAIE